MIFFFFFFNIIGGLRQNVGVCRVAQALLELYRSHDFLLLLLLIFSF